jgi:hypothetical protein
MNLRSILETALLVFETTIFSAWLVVSALVYIPAIKKEIRKRDIFGLIPQWNFFAPHPAQHDFHLLYQDQLQDGSVTAWTELALFDKRPFWSIVWNPEKRCKKALSDAVTDLAKHIRSSIPALELSIPYLTLLNYISGIPRIVPPKLTQFLIVSSGHTNGRYNSQPFYLSRVHSF